jgi:hypothetical protein
VTFPEETPPLGGPQSARVNPLSFARESLTQPGRESANGKLATSESLPCQARRL